MESLSQKHLNGMRHAQIKSTVWEFSTTQWSIHWDCDLVKAGHLITGGIRFYRYRYDDQKNIQPCIHLSTSERSWTRKMIRTRPEHDNLPSMPKSCWSFRPPLNRLGPLLLPCRHLGWPIPIEGRAATWCLDMTMFNRIHGYQIGWRSAR